MHLLVRKNFIPLLCAFLINAQLAYNQGLTEIVRLPSIINETSGIAMASGGRFWTFNDSGGNPELYLCDTSGTLISKVPVVGAWNRDWEDITRDDQGNLYIGNIGNNNNDTRDLAIFKVPNPELESNRPLKAEVIYFSYEDQEGFPPEKDRLHFDAETLMWFEGNLYICTKNRTIPFDGKTYLYRLPATPGRHVAEKIGSFDTEGNDMFTYWITAGDISPDGKRLCLLSSDKLWIFFDFTGDDFFNGKNIRIDLPSATQKEAVCFADNNTLLITDEQWFGGIGRNLYALNITKELSKRDIQHGQWNPKLNRIEYIIGLKNDVAREYWPSFASRDLFCPLVLYRFDGTYAFNPNEHILTHFEHTEIKSGIKDGENIILLSNDQIDTTDLQFANNYSSTDSSALYFLNWAACFSDLEVSRQFIPDLTDLQDWSIMVIHELFHSYQMSHEGFMDEHLKTMHALGKHPDDLIGNFHKELEWYRNSVKQENELLVAIWKDSADIKANLKAFTALRNARMARIKQEKNVDIEALEDMVMLMEGHARFFESCSKQYLSENTPDQSMLDAEDKNSITGMYEAYAPEEDKGLYGIYNNRYWYALGFNISMILSRHYPKYEKSLYKKQYNFNKYIKEMSGH